jgi:hypothetical protein
MEFINTSGNTRSGFFHKSKLYFNGELLAEARASYLNRTWEAYTYQSVMKQAVRNAIENEVGRIKEEREIKRLTKKLREQIETESELVVQLKDKLKTL